MDYLHRRLFIRDLLSTSSHTFVSVHAGFVYQNAIPNMFCDIACNNLWVGRIRAQGLGRANLQSCRVRVRRK